MTEELLNNFEVKFEDMTTKEVITYMNDLAGEKACIEEQLKGVNAEYDYLRLNLIPNRFEEEGIENITIEGIGRVSLTGDMYVSVLAENREKMYEWLDEIGKDSLITKTVNASTLKAAVKAMIRAGEEIPEDLIKVTPFTRASITRK